MCAQDRIQVWVCFTNITVNITNFVLIKNQPKKVVFVWFVSLASFE